ncbi:PREDICTED: early endosome antigen 1-like, partial [Poecilia mexicana]|uniref:early endosome antigen 1-like n=1 Tax=Poecilia mexicana TaxID=48701 RepID=UPI00072EA756
MLKTQQKIKKSNEVKPYMDKLACIKYQVNKWKLTQPPVTSGLLKEKLEGTQREVRSEILTDKQNNSGAEKNPLENIRISEGYVIEEKTEIHEKFFKHINEGESFPQEMQALEKQINELNEQEEVLRVQIKTNIRKLQDKTQKMRSIVTELDEIQCQKTDAEVIIREMGTVESKLLQEVQQRDYLMEKTNVFRKQIMQTDLENQTKTTIVEKKLDMKSLEKWKEDPQALAKETEVCSDGKYLRLTDLQRLRTEIYQTQQIMKLIKPEIGCQVRTGNETKDLVDNEIKGLLQDLRQFQKLLETEVGQKKLNLNVDTCIQKSAMKKKRRELDHKLENILRERDELEMLKTKIQRKSEGTQRQLEKILKCQNDIEKIAGKAKESSKVIMYNMNKSVTKVRIIEDLNKKIEASKQCWNKIYLLTSQHKALTEKLKTELGHENERESLFERENIKRSEKLERDKSFTGKKTTQADETFEEFLVLTPHQERLIEEIKLIIEQLIYRKCNSEEKNLELSETVIQEILRKVSEMFAQDTGAEGQNGKLSQMKIEHNKKAFLGETNERQKQHMTEGQDMIKWTREIGEMEVLNAELEIKSKGNKAILKQMVREAEKNEKMMNEIKEAKMSFKREVQKRRRELDQRLEKIRREKDELEMLKLKLRQPNAAMFHDNQKAQDQRTVVCVLTENEPKDLERNGWRITKTQYETVPKSPGLRDTINNIRDLGVKIYGYLETVKSEICQILKHQNVDLDKKRDETTALTTENNTVKENIARIKSLKGIYKMTKQWDVDETRKLRKDTHNQEFRIKSLTTKQKAKKRKALMTEMVTDETKQQRQKKRMDAKDPFGEIDKKKTIDNLEKHVKTQMETLQVLMKKITLKNIKKGIELYKIQSTHKSLSNMGRQLEDNNVKLVNLIDIIKNMKERTLRHENQLTATGKDKMEKPKTEINQEIEEPNSSLEETNKEKIKLDIQ